MVVNDNYEEDGHSSSSSTRLLLQHPMHFQEELVVGVDRSTVPPTPLFCRHYHLSHMRRANTDGSSTPHKYSLRAKPEGLLATNSSRDNNQVSSQWV